MSRGDIFAGIDLGGTKILTLLADATGRVLGLARVPTGTEQGPEAVIARIAETVRAAAGDAQVDLADVRAAGVSAPGPIDARAGIITDPPNLPGWHNVPLASSLHERLSVPTLLENDANCQGVAEHQFGAGRGYAHMIFITVSTGIGGGIILNNELYTGASGAAGEIGHIGVSIDGPACGAGHVGCLEAFASGTAIAARARDMIAAGGLIRTARLAEHDPPVSAKTVFLAGQQGEAEATAIIESAGRYLGIGLASLINIFNPQAIVIGGGVSNMGETLLGPAVETARSRAFAQSFADVRIIEGALGERAGALGALAVARNAAARGTI